MCFKPMQLPVKPSNGDTSLMAPVESIGTKFTFFPSQALLTVVAMWLYLQRKTFLLEKSSFFWFNCNGVYNSPVLWHKRSF